MPNKKTAIVTGASRGIGAGLVEAFLREDYNVVATAQNAKKSLTETLSLVLVEGDIGRKETAAKAVEAAIEHFGTIDVLVNNAGIFYTKPFTEFTTEDFNALASTNLLGFIYITQLTVNTNAQAEIRVRFNHHCRTCRSADRRRQCLSFDDDEGRPECRDSESGDRVCQRRYPI